MRRTVTGAVIAAALLLSPSALAGGAGKSIQDACGASFGQLVSAGKSGGDAAHGNYAGGARAFSDPAILAAHGCTP